MKIILSVIKGPHQGRTFEFSERDTFVVGRATYAHFRLAEKDPYFSRAHFVIEVNPPLCRLLDLSSSNGTWVNSKRVTEIDLVDGDRIRGGDTEILIRVSKPEQPTGSESPPSRPEEQHRVTIRESPDSVSDDSPRKAQREPLGQLLKTGNYQAAPVDPDKEFPRRLGPYELTGKLGEGGMGTVYQASQLSGLTLHGEMGGSFGFMAPEQITNYRNTTPSADLYSAAATLYFLLTGKLTYQFPEKLSDRVLMILQKECIPIAKRRPDIPPALAKVIHQALHRNPNKRFPGALQLLAALQGSIS